MTGCDADARTLPQLCAVCGVWGLAYRWYSQPCNTVINIVTSCRKYKFYNRKLCSSILFEHWFCRMWYRWGRKAVVCCQLTFARGKHWIELHVIFGFRIYSRTQKRHRHREWASMRLCLPQPKNHILWATETQTNSEIWLHRWALMRRTQYSLTHTNTDCSRLSLCHTHCKSIVNMYRDWHSSRVCADIRSYVRRDHYLKIYTEICKIKH